MISPDMSLTDRSPAVPKTLIQEEWQINPVIVVLGHRPTNAQNPGFFVLTPVMVDGYFIAAVIEVELLITKDKFCLNNWPQLVWNPFQSHVRCPSPSRPSFLSAPPHDTIDFPLQSIQTSCISQRHHIQLRQIHLITVLILNVKSYSWW